jgi:hypothetical protein
MRKEKWLDKIKPKIIMAFIFEALFFMQCNLYGPEPGDPVFPAQIDPGDSAAVRAILDSNNLKNISVRRAIDQSSVGRIQMLTFDSLGLDSFTFSSDFQKLDNLWSVNLSNNNLVKVTVPESLKYSKNNIYLQLEKNLLTEFPIGVLKIKGLLRVDVSYNKISTISNDLINSGFRQISFYHDKLCSVSDSVKTWLDSVQNNWANFQDCP